MKAASLLPFLAVGWVLSQNTNSNTEDEQAITDSLSSLLGNFTTTIDDATVPTGEYITYTTTSYLTSHGSVIDSTAVEVTATPGSNITVANATTTSTSDTVTVLMGGQTTISGNATNNATQTSSHTPSATPVVNTQPCNGWPEFCNRKYSNITMVAAHNSPFVVQGNVASNQALDVEYQLDDGIRMLQFQVHNLNGTMQLCHTNCDMLNVGPLEDYLTTVTNWMKQHPYDVVTILIGNYDYVDPGNFTAPIENSGLMDLVFTPPAIPMGLDDWPTLGSIILSGKRALVFMDYQANQTAYPWLMDEFSQIWETPFSPTDREFPCTVQRPPDLADDSARERMYMANHNLNLEINIASLNLLIPNTALLNETNADTGFGSLGWMADNCTTMWNRPPNFLLVDYYNEGNFNGSVFEVAADMNNVTYDRNSCCGTLSAAVNLVPGTTVMSAVLLLVGVQILASAF
ncbi:PLC-like phosphodiesterase [Aspergillus pseudoustus]|uniref:PLC-like phosphodiesterase n=1 Tax=Aspergillus pseudoustus TaxID=1810923 RepID=A0ABR4J7U7_9EURO